MTPTTDELSLTVSRHIAAAPAKVYAAWLNPLTLRRFLAGSDAVAVARVETDPRIGGSFLIEMANAGQTPMAHTGNYLALDPFERISFTWVSPYSTVEGSTVTLTFAPEGSGTLVTLTQRRFLTEGNRDGHAAGWAMFLDALAATDL